MTQSNQQISAVLAHWIEQVERMHPENIALGLARVQTVFERMAIKFSCPVVIVGGTNGKGSTCEMLQSIWHAAGFKVALYTSPHIRWFNERIRINREMVDDETLVAAFERVQKARGDVALTFFEFTTLVAFSVFMQAQPDVVILEVGLGGRLDAVNVIDADVGVVTNVDIDHVNFLGHTKEAIGKEKAGIYRSKTPAFYGDVQAPHSLIEHAKEIGADLKILDQHYRYTVKDNAWDYDGLQKITGLPLPSLPGLFQIKNATTVIAVIETLQKRLPVDRLALETGLTHTVLTGRFQTVSKNPMIICDVAHNPHAARVLAENLRQTAPANGRTFAVYGAMADKDIDGVIHMMQPFIDQWYVCDLPLPRAAKACDIQTKLEQAKACVGGIFSTVSDALSHAQNNLQNNDRIITFGSFWVISGLPEQLQKQLPVKHN